MISSKALRSTTRSLIGGNAPKGCGLDCKEELFGNLADHSQLCILQTLCEGAKTDAQIATATSFWTFCRGEVSNQIRGGVRHLREKRLRGRL